LKINTVPQAIVASVAIVSVAALVGFLVWSGWSAASIVAFASLAAGLFAGQYVTSRKAALLDAKQDQQSVKLDRVVAQTNGPMHATIAQAVESGIARGVAAARWTEPARQQADDRATPNGDI
jgi:hypothetical protein